MLTLAMILDNPGERPHQTQYRAPQRLADLGYSDLIVYLTTGLSGLLGPQTVRNAEMRRWVEEEYERIRQTLSDAHRAGMGAWITFDSPSLATELVGSAMTCVNRTPTMLCPASDELLDMCGQCLEALISTLDPVEGVVLRLGDNDAAKLPYLSGNDVYVPHCARCSNLGRGDRLVRFIRFYYDLVVGRLGRKLIVRAWNLRPGGMHDDAQLCKRVIDQLPVDDRLIFSFKFTQTDFWRYQPWNAASLECGDRPIIYELQCQREFEGKGAVPNFQPPLWRDGMKELDGALGLADVSQRANVVGLWAWVRGGGWRGPYVSSDAEWWIDANVAAVPALAVNPQADPQELARVWIRTRLGLEPGPAFDAVLQILLNSTQTVLESFYIGPYARRRPNSWHPTAHFIQDDQIDAEAAWTIIQRMPEADLDEVVAEKAAAEKRLAEDRAALKSALPMMDRSLAEFLGISLQFNETLVSAINSLLAALVAYRRYLRKHDPSLVATALSDVQRCQNRWVQHTQRVASHAAASPFNSDNLWDLTQRITDQLTQASQRVS